MGPDRELAAAIEGLYSAFRDYERPETFLGCVCCWAGEPLADPYESFAEAVVQSPGGKAPLRTLTAEELAEVASQMPLLGGTIGLYKHYLPRLYEIAVTEGFEDTNFAWLMSRLMCDLIDDSDWSRWPELERAALRQFLHALWRHRLAAPLPHYCRSNAFLDTEVDEILCALAQADSDVDWYLDEWLRFEEPYAARHLDAFLADNIAHLRRKRRLANEWWDFDDNRIARANHDRIVEWIRSPATKDAIAAAAEQSQDQEELNALAECYLRWLA